MGNHVRQHNKRCTRGNNTLTEQKFRRNSKFSPCEEMKYFSIFDQNEYLRELEQTRMKRLDKNIERVFPRMNNRANHVDGEPLHEQTKDPVDLPPIKVLPILKLRDISNNIGRQESRDTVQRPPLSLESTDFSIYSEIESNNKWDDLKIEASKTFDEGEMPYIFELDWEEASNSFDEDEGIHMLIEEDLNEEVITISQ